MTVLLDTNALLWWLDSPEILSEPARQAICDPTRTVYVSSVSVMEIIIKQSLGKLRIDKPWEPAIDASNFTHLPFSYAHACMLRELAAIHKDPFDRMLLAQAKVEKATLVTGDKTLAEYGLSVLLT